MRLAVLAPIAAALLTGATVAAQQPASPANSLLDSGSAQSAQPSIATVPLQGVSLSGSLSVANGRAVIGNNGTITAGDHTAHVALTRGGDLDVCASTKIHLSTDNTSGSNGAGALMIALDHGALEAHYTPGQFSDVLLTPDLRILISGPGKADLSLRVSRQGDTCIDNHGDHAPYVLVSNAFEGGAYRVQANQRVLFEGGSLQQVVDNEKEPCGCPSDLPVSVASAGTSGASPARPGQKKSAAEENPFPLAESEGLAAPPAPPTTPIVPAGTPHAQVEAPLAYNSANPVLPPEPAGPGGQGTEAAGPQATAQPPAPPTRPHTSFFGHIGHFFRRLFGG